MSKTTIHVFAKWVVQDDKLDEVLTNLQKVAQKTREEEGNLFYKLHQSIADTNTIVIFEGYKDQASQDIHNKSTYFQEFVIGKIIPLLKERQVTATHPID